MGNDRRVRRTLDLLQNALRELVQERGYDAITVQDITARANVGRSTFYAHYTGKDDLFLGCHEAITREFEFGPHRPLSRDEWLSQTAPPGMAAAYRHLAEVRVLFLSILQSRDGLLILRRLRDWRAQDIAASLRGAFASDRSVVPLDVLAHYLAGAQIGMVQWWLENRQPYTPEELARTIHRLHRAAIRDAFGLGEGVSGR